MWGGKGELPDIPLCSVSCNLPQSRKLQLPQFSLLPPAPNPLPPKSTASLLQSTHTTTPASSHPFLTPPASQHARREASSRHSQAQATRRPRPLQPCPLPSANSRPAASPRGPLIGRRSRHSGSEPRPSPPRAGAGERPEHPREELSGEQRRGVAVAVAPVRLSAAERQGRGGQRREEEDGVAEE